MVRNNNSLDCIIADYVYGFVKKEFGETLPITISAQDLKEKQSIMRARSSVISTLTMLYHSLEERYPITKEYMRIQPLESELLVGGKCRATPDGYELVVANYKKQLQGNINLKFYINYEHKTGRARKSPYIQLLTYVLISTYKMRRSFRKNVKPFAIGLLINNGGKIINGFIVTRYLDKEKIEVSIYWPMKTKYVDYELDYKILAEGIRESVKKNKSLRKGLRQKLNDLYNLI